MVSDLLGALAKSPSRSGSFLVAIEGLTVTAVDPTEEAGGRRNEPAWTLTILLAGLLSFKTLVIKFLSRSSKSLTRSVSVAGLTAGFATD